MGVKWTCQRGPLGEPVADRRGFVRAVVVHDEVDIEARRHVALDLVEKLAELDRAMAGHAFADDGSGLHVERCEQRGRAVPLVVVRAPLGLTGAHRQQRLRAIQRLHLAFLVDAQHHGALRRRQVQADDIAHLLDEQRIGRQFESLGAMRLQAEGAPDPLHRRRSMGNLFGHGS